MDFIEQRRVDRHVGGAINGVVDDEIPHAGKTLAADYADYADLEHSYVLNAPNLRNPRNLRLILLRNGYRDQGAPILILRIPNSECSIRTGSESAFGLLEIVDRLNVEPLRAGDDTGDDHSAGDTRFFRRAALIDSADKDAVGIWETAASQE
jgi:hypothetical protein